MLTSELMASVQRRAMVPNAQATFQTTDFYALIDEEISSKLIPLILRCMEEFYVRDFPYNIAQGVNSYMVPPRAIAGKLRNVQIISSTQPDSIVSIERLDVSDLYMSTASTYQALIQKSGFYFKGNNVILYPTPKNSQNILNLVYYIRPNSSVDPAQCGLIQSINLTTNQLTVASLPTNITTQTLVDLVRAQPGFECQAIDQTISSIAGNVITLSGPIPSTLSVGDYVCQATQSCVVQVPQELLPLLSQYVVVRILSAQGDLMAFQEATMELGKLEENAELLIAPRADGNPKRVVNTRGISRFT